MVSMGRYSYPEHNGPGLQKSIEPTLLAVGTKIMDDKRKLDSRNHVSFSLQQSDARTGEVRARAVARGVKTGPSPRLTQHQMKEALRRCDNGEPMCDIARTFKVSHNTVSPLA